MNKSELINAVAGSAELSKAAAGKAVDAMLAAIVRAMEEGDQVTLVGFGTFSVKDRPGRTGRDPRNAEAIDIPPHKVPAFKAGPRLRAAVRG